MLLFVRWILPGALVVVGLIILIARGGDGTGLEGAALFAGAGIAVWLLNAIYRFGARGDTERDEEEAARRHFDEHGRWPDEEPGT